METLMIQFLNYYLCSGYFFSWSEPKPPNPQRALNFKSVQDELHASKHFHTLKTTYHLVNPTFSFNIQIFEK